jgi:hypothetical protein
MFKRWSTILFESGQTEEQVEIDVEIFTQIEEQNAKRIRSWQNTSAYPADDQFEV